jgi:hypothetical protein
MRMKQLDIFDVAFPDWNEPVSLVFMSGLDLDMIPGWTHFLRLTAAQSSLISAHACMSQDLVTNISIPRSRC